MQAITAEPGKWRERIMFTILSILIWPIVATAFVGAYGFSFWIYFMLSGPPGAH